MRLPMVPLGPCTRGLLGSTDGAASTFIPEQAYRYASAVGAHRVARKSRSSFGSWPANTKTSEPSGASASSRFALMDRCTSSMEKVRMSPARQKPNLAGDDADGGLRPSTDCAIGLVGHQPGLLRAAGGSEDGAGLVIRLFRLITRRATSSDLNYSRRPGMDSCRLRADAPAFLPTFLPTATPSTFKVAPLPNEPDKTGLEVWKQVDETGVRDSSGNVLATDTVTVIRVVLSGREVASYTGTQRHVIIASRQHLVSSSGTVDFTLSADRRLLTLIEADGGERALRVDGTGVTAEKKGRNMRARGQGGAEKQMQALVLAGAVDSSEEAAWEAAACARARERVQELLLEAARSVCPEHCGLRAGRWKGALGWAPHRHAPWPRLASAPHGPAAARLAAPRLSPQPCGPPGRSPRAAPRPGEPESLRAQVEPPQGGRAAERHGERRRRPRVTPPGERYCLWTELKSRTYRLQLYHRFTPHSALYTLQCHAEITTQAPGDRLGSQRRGLVGYRTLHGTFLAPCRKCCSLANGRCRIAHRLPPTWS